MKMVDWEMDRFEAAVNRLGVFLLLIITTPPLS